MKDKDAIYLDGRSPLHQWEPFAPYRDEYSPLYGSNLPKTASKSVVTAVFYLGTLRVCRKRDCDVPHELSNDTAAWMSIPVCPTIRGAWKYALTCRIIPTFSGIDSEPSAEEIQPG
jgi:hypothetical protein